MLLPHKPNEPIYFGCRFKPFVKQGYMSGGAGYVLSKEAVRRFVVVRISSSLEYQSMLTFENLCRKVFKIPQDVQRVIVVLKMWKWENAWKQ